MAKRPATLIFLLGLLILAIPLVLKGLHVEEFVQHYTGTRWLGFFQVLANDAVIYCGLLLLLYGSVLSETPRLLAAIFRLLAVLGFVVYSTDYLIIANFNTHLAVGDVIKYVGYAHKYIQQIYGLGGIGLGLLGIGLVLLVLLLMFGNYRMEPGRHRYLPVIILLALPLLAASLADRQKYAHAWIYQNVIDYNLTILSESAPYSPGFIGSQHYTEAEHCQLIPASQKNIILLMVESLSAYQSQYFSGLNDWTPQLDAIAKQNAAFTNFYANGFITEDGEIALLTGILPIYPPSSYSDDGGSSFYSFYGVPAALPKVLKKHGYQTEFLTSADLDFGNTGNWAKSIGFGYIEGHAHPDYEHWERFHFQAAPDEALYQRALNRLQQNREQPVFMFIKTVSSHHPYINPENKHKSESEVIRYTDKQIGIFYRHLQNSGFFNNGLLFIVGDHHSMMPLKKAELDLYGQYQASAKVPLAIVGNGLFGTDTQAFQQTDVFNSITGLVSGRQCASDWSGVLFGEYKSPPTYIVHRRGDNRNMLSVFADQAEFLIKLDGDQTRLLGNSELTAGLAPKLVGKINALRISRANWAAQTVTP